MGETVARLVERLRKLRPSAEAAPDAPAQIRLTCSGCGKTLKVKGSLAGKKVKCPHCQAVIPVPITPEPPGEELPPSPAPGAGEAVTIAPTGPVGGRSSAGTQSHHEAGSSQPASNELYDFLAPAQSPDELGRLGPYRVLKVLGAGGMGVVFRAEDPHLARHVAIKAMLPTLAASDSARQRFLREARAAAAIKHDHIVTIHQVGEDHGVPFLAMEFLEGEPLDARLEREGMLPVAEVLRIGREVALALAAAHKRDMIHRDIKPANIWLESPADEPGASATGGRVKILDFGLARAVGEGGQLTQQGAIIGTPAYMAPEQAQGKKLDGRCDLFSLGCVLYRLATGKPAFKGSDMVSTLMAVATDEPPPPVSLNIKLPTELSDLVMQLLAKEPDQRPASAKSVADALQEMEKRLQPTATGAAPAPQPDRSGKKRRPVAWLVGLAGGLAAAVVAGIVLFWQTPQGTVKIEIDDPAIKVVFVENGVTITGADKKPIMLRPGEHSIRVKRGDFEFNTDKFEIKKTLKVTLLRGKIQALADDKVIDEREVPRVAVAAANPDRRAAKWVLSLGGTVHVRMAGAEKAIDAVEKLPAEDFELVWIDLRDKPVSDAGLANLQGLINLKFLGLHHTGVSDAGMAHLKNLAKLEELHLFANPNVTDAGLAHLKGLTNLKNLDLNGTGVSDAGMVHLQGLTNLVYLNLDVTGVSGAGVSGAGVSGAGVSGAGVSGAGVSDAGVSDAGVSDAGLAHLKGLTNLSVLILKGTKVSNAGLVHLQGLPKLQRLNLDATKVSGAGLEHLKSLTNLDQLELCGCTNVSDAELVHLQGLPKLQILMLDATKVSGAGLEHLKGLTNFKSLHLNGTGVSDAGMVHLKGLTNLTHLELRGTGVSDAGLKHLYGLSNLWNLWLTNTKVTAEGIAALQKALPKCKIHSDFAAEGAADPDRRAAEWVLSIGGKVTVRTAEQEREVAEIKNLPPDPFQVIAIETVANKKMNDNGLVLFKPLKTSAN
jgi:hypothetical protein